MLIYEVIYWRCPVIINKVIIEADDKEHAEEKIYCNMLTDEELENMKEVGRYNGKMGIVYITEITSN